LYSNEEFNDRSNKYLSFIAPTIHDDVMDFFGYSIVKSKSSGFNVGIKPYSLSEFVTVTKLNENFEDMTNYTNNVITEFKNNLN
jgi:hypothetical protein